MARTSSTKAPTLEQQIATAVAAALAGMNVAPAAKAADDNRPATGGQLWSLNRYAPEILYELVAKGSATYAVCFDTVAMLKDEGRIPASKRDSKGSRS